MTPAETANDMALIANTHWAPMRETNNPPTRGPTRMPRFRPRETVPLAHAIWSSPTRFGMAAADAEMNAGSARADRNEKSTRLPGEWTSAMAPKHTAPISSHTTIKRLRSSRSPRIPPTGPNSPSAPKVASAARVSQAAEWVSEKMVNIRAV